MIIVRERRHSQFEILPHELLKDQRLSFRARGIAVRLLANMDDYKMSAGDLARQSPGEGRYVVLKALRELEDLGYLIRNRQQDARGRWSTTSTIRDTPSPTVAGVQSLHSGDVTEVQSPDVGPPAPGQPAFGAPKFGPLDSKSTNTKTRTKITTTTHPVPNLDVPSHLDVEQQQVVVKMLAGIPEELQQTLLDELTGALASVRPPNRPVSWFRALVARASRGEYVPELAVAVAGARKRQEAEAQAARERQEEAAAAEMRRRDPVARAKRMAAMQAAMAAVND